MEDAWVLKNEGDVSNLSVTLSISFLCPGSVFTGDYSSFLFV